MYHLKYAKLNHNKLSTSFVSLIVSAGLNRSYTNMYALACCTVDQSTQRTSVSLQYTHNLLSSIGGRRYVTKCPPIASPMCSLTARKLNIKTIRIVNYYTSIDVYLYEVFVPLLLSTLCFRCIWLCLQ